MSDYLMQPVVSGHVEAFQSCPCRRAKCEYPDCPLGDPGTLHACAVQQAYNPYPLDLSELHAFLLGYGYSDIVGLSCDDGKCPLACFLNVQNPGSTFFVNLTEYSRNMDDISLGCEPDATFPLPAWARSFVWLVDVSTDCVEHTPITALDALSALYAACVSHGLLQEVAL